jgi:hypothetical protein
MILESNCQLTESRPPAYIPSYFPNAKIQPSGILTLKSRIPFRIVPENGSAVQVSIHQSDLPAFKINPELPS